MEFMVGCNYWASNAGADMWRDFDLDAVKKDVKILAQYGIKYFRVFPNWRDFQPVAPVTVGSGRINGFCLENDIEPTNDYYIDETMMDRFAAFLDVCAEYDIKVVVGLITGWMSGRMYIPSALYGKNLICDPLAQYFQQLFIRGFIARFKDSPVIYAWDLGNECNCMSPATWTESVNWTAMISNAIKAADPTRPVVSGMHSLKVERNMKWRIVDQGNFTDILTTHPYPFWCAFTRIDDILSLRTTMHATTETKLYAEISGKPCMAEEIGTMGPMLCSDENAAKFMRTNLYSLWANNAAGAMWWCANDQTMLTKVPYTENMVELELGLLDKHHQPKPVIKEIHKFTEFMKTVDFELPEAEKDAVCLLTEDQQQWGVAYMTQTLLSQVGLNCKFAYPEKKMPDAKLYLVPSINGRMVMNQLRYVELKEKVAQGAVVYISMDNGILSEFEEFTGLKVLDSCELTQNNTLDIDGTELQITRKRRFTMQETTAQVLARDADGNPTVCVNNYGKGKVIFVNFPLESTLIDTPHLENKKYDLIYKKLFAEYIEKKPVHISCKDVAITYHHAEDGSLYVILVNHSHEAQELNLTADPAYKLEKVYYGNAERIEAWDACVLKFTR